MTREEAIERTLNLFPRLYYFIQSHKPRPIECKSGNTVRLNEEKYAVLWLLELFLADTKQDSCLGQELQKLFEWRHPKNQANEIAEESQTGKTKRNSRFDSAISELRRAGYINTFEDPDDRKHNRVHFTKEGRNLIEELREERREVVNLLFNLTDEYDEVVKELNKVALFTWNIMKSGEPDMASRRDENLSDVQLPNSDLACDLSNQHDKIAEDDTTRDHQESVIISE